jgi:glycosyltransferase involved in cell wall biosynthesis
MNILLVHEYYRQPGGEDKVFTAERELLSSAGHEVITHTDENQRISEIGRMRLAAVTMWNSTAARTVRELTRAYSPEIVHFHNTFPLLSPSVYRAARTEGAAIVQTLHNFRLFCVNGLFLRDGKVCKDCLGHLPWRGVANTCYRSSILASGVVASMLTVHRALKTWSRYVDAYIALSEHSRKLFVQGGLPPERLHVKPNFLLNDPEKGDGEGDFLLFVGRLSPEKGIRTLLHCWRQLGPRAPRLKVAGSGPLSAHVREAAASIPRLKYLGQLSSAQVRRLMGQATALLVPSAWFEGLPMVVLEAFGCGLPVVASRIGSFPELIDHGRTGWLVPPEDRDAWRRTIEQIVQNPRQLREMRSSARAEYESKYTGTHNVERLLAVYGHALESRRQT